MEVINTKFILYTTVYISGPDIYTVVYKINAVLLTDVQYLFVCCNTSGWKTCLKKKKKTH